MVVRLGRDHKFRVLASALELPGDDDEYLFPSSSVKDAPITAHAMARFAKSLDPNVGKSWRVILPPRTICGAQWQRG